MIPVPVTSYAYLTVLLLVLWPLLLLIWWSPDSATVALILVLVTLSVILFEVVRRRCSSKDCSLLFGFKIISARLAIGCANISILYVPIVLVGVYFVCIFYVLRGLRREPEYTRSRWLGIVYKFAEKGQVADDPATEQFLDELGERGDVVSNEQQELEGKMNNKNWRIIGIVAIVLLVAAGAGFVYLVPRYQDTLADLSSVKGTLSTTQADLAIVSGQLSQTQGQLSSVQQTLSSTQGQLSSTQASLSSVQGQLSGARSELSDTQVELSSTLAELESIQGKFPLERFSTNLALESWLSLQPNPPSSSDAVLWLRHALDLQQAAADDGFLISADYYGPFEDDTYVVWCSAVIANGSYYWWDPDTDDIYYALDINHF